ncbi:MAG: RHS repeat-associated core domain-containing protein, partial [Prevotellaceae bacterium]|nr:RHS repeat-associated core domain-containing protein [Prevotellaceae bacterium]
MKTKILLLILCILFTCVEITGQTDTTQYNITLPTVSFKQSLTYTANAYGMPVRVSTLIVHFSSSQQPDIIPEDELRFLNNYIEQHGWGDILRIYQIKYLIRIDTTNASNNYNALMLINILHNDSDNFRKILITGNLAGSDTVIVNQSNIMPDNYPNMSGNSLLTRTYTKANSSYFFEDIMYYDALGYPEQKINVTASPNRQNIVTPVVFDNMKRNVKNFLPYVSTISAFSNDNDPLIHQQTYYANIYDTVEAAYAFVKKEYEPSILNRVVKEYNVGSAFQGGNDKYRLYSYQTNSANEVFMLDINDETSALTVSGYYQQGELYKNTITNEDKSTTVIFTDKNEKIILQRIIDSALNNDTYYAYDEYGQQRWVITPEGVTRLNNGVTYQPNSAYASLYCYTYKYDGRGNIVERQMPGKDAEYMIYDKGGRLVMMQDGNMRQNNTWIYNVYDDFNRPVEKNIVQTQKTKEEIQAIFFDENYNNDYVSIGNANKIFSPFAPTFSSSAYNYSLERTRYYGGLYFGNNISTSATKYLRGNDANMPTIPSLPHHGPIYSICDSANVLLDDNNHIKNEYFYGYDEDNMQMKYYRLPTQKAISVAQCLIATYPNSFFEIMDEAPIIHQGIPWVNPQILAFEPVDSICTSSDLEKQTSKGLKAYEKLRILDNGNRYVERAFYYDYWGRVIQTVEKNHLGSISRYSVKYDFAGNIMTTHEQHQTQGVIGIGSNSKKLTEFVYDHRGRLKTENTTLNDSISTTVSYTYTELGQQAKTVFGNNIVTEIKKYNIQGWLTEQQVNTWTGGFSTQRSHIFKTQLKYYDAVRATPSYTGNITEWTWQHQNDTANTYTFAYDRLNRLIDNKYYMGTSTTPLDIFTEQGLAYDRNGNIAHIQRYDANGDCNECDIHYMYSGNRLTSYRRGMLMNMISLYGYDSNGNMNRDFRKNLDITYNLLNLPYEIGQNDTIRAVYTYIADGTKVAVRSDSLTYRFGFDYLGTCVYKRENNNLTVESTNFAGGRISKTSNGYEANYFITDHLGSVRVIVGDNGEIKEQKDYYPFGKEHENASLMNSANRYTFSGKEQQTAGAVNWLDFGARMYDSQTGRWLTQDPLAENFYSVSQYAYCANNPVRYIDPNGMAWQEPDDDDDECDEEDDEHMDASDGGGGSGGGSGGGNNDDDDGYIFGGTLEESVCVARRPLSNAQIRYMVWNNTY